MLLNQCDTFLQKEHIVFDLLELEFLVTNLSSHLLILEMYLLPCEMIVMKGWYFLYWQFEPYSLIIEVSVYLLSNIKFDNEYK